MKSLILGLLLGLLISLLIIMIGSVIYDCCYERWQEITCLVIIISLCLISTIGITFGVCSYNKFQNICYIEEYKVTKQTIEESVKNTDITGFERLQLVDTAIKENKELKQKQFDCQQWYGFLIDEGVLELEPISFN